MRRVHGLRVTPNTVVKAYGELEAAGDRELPEWMRVNELMRYTQAYHSTWDASYARQLLESFALDPSKKVKELSKGMRAQAGLVAAVAHRPELLILDEPSSGLDAIVRRDILDAIVRTVADDGRTVIFSSHLLDEVERMSDHVTIGSLIAAGEVFGDPLRSGQRLLEGAVGALTRQQQVALAVVASIGVPIWVASWAALGALWARYPRRLNIARSLLLLYGVALVLLTLAASRWDGLEIPLGAIVRATSWLAAAAITLATAYLAWRTFAERLLTSRQAWGIVLLSVLFAAAWLTMLRAAGLSLAKMPAADALRMLLPALLPLTISVLAPWSYSRVRHT